MKEYEFAILNYKFRVGYESDPHDKTKLDLKRPGVWLWNGHYWEHLMKLDYHVAGLPAQKEIEFPGCESELNEIDKLIDSAADK